MGDGHSIDRECKHSHLGTVGNNRIDDDDDCRVMDHTIAIAKIGILVLVDVERRDPFLGNFFFFFLLL